MQRPPSRALALVSLSVLPLPHVAPPQAPRRGLASWNKWCLLPVIAVLLLAFPLAPRHPLTFPQAFGGIKIPLPGMTVADTPLPATELLAHTPRPHGPQHTGLLADGLGDCPPKLPGLASFRSSLYLGCELGGDPASLGWGGSCLVALCASVTVDFHGGIGPPSFTTWAESLGILILFTVKSISAHSTAPASWEVTVPTGLRAQGAWRYHLCGGGLWVRHGFSGTVLAAPPETESAGPRGQGGTGP